jgi:2'-5' RNA ligase
MRLFVAAEIPEALRRRLLEIQATLRDLPLRVRWVRQDAMHLTFSFLGEVPSSRLQPIEEAMERVDALPVSPFRLEARGIGTFPPKGRPRVIWAGLLGDLEAAGRLKSALDAALEPLGFRPEDRAFKPHLTLGRVAEARGGGDWRSVLDALAAEAFGVFEVGALVLFESRLLPEGAQYSALKQFPLRAGTAAPR